MSDTKWLTDGNGNKCSVEYYGSEAAAQTALDSLKLCRDCINCSRCSGCEKKHCRAGWIVTLAGPEGKALENFYNTELAAMLIYHASTGRKIHPARFYDSDEAALTDMKALAEATE